MRGWRVSVGAVAVALLAAACGSSTPARHAAGAGHGKFSIEITRASFPTHQRLSQHTNLVLKVRNAGSLPIPNIAVTILNPSSGTPAQAFGMLLPQSNPGQPILANRTRPVWVVDKPPGVCGYSCRAGGPGGAVTAYDNTWALGTLKPGRTATFQWAVTAVRPGTYTVDYEFAAGLNRQARTVLAGGGGPARGSFQVRISGKPREAYVNNNGQIVYSG